MRSGGNLSQASRVSFALRLTNRLFDLSVRKPRTSLSPFSLIPIPMSPKFFSLLVLLVIIPVLEGAGIGVNREADVKLPPDDMDADAKPVGGGEEEIRIVLRDEVTIGTLPPGTLKTIIVPNPPTPNSNLPPTGTPPTHDPNPVTVTRDPNPVTHDPNPVTGDTKNGSNRISSWCTWSFLGTALAIAFCVPY